MKILIYAVCLLLLLAYSTNSMPPAISGDKDSKPEAHGGQIETKYDGFNFETVVTLRKMRVACGSSKAQRSNLENSCVSIVAALHCPGVQLNYVRHARLQLIFEAKDWVARHPYGQRDLIAVADGETLRLGTMKLANADIDTDQGIDVMKEILDVTIPYATFVKMAKASVLEIRIGTSTFSLKDKNLWALKDLNNRVKV